MLLLLLPYSTADSLLQPSVSRSCVLWGFQEKDNARITKDFQINVQMFTSVSSSTLSFTHSLVKWGD